MPPERLTGEELDPVLEPFLNASLESAAEQAALRVLIDRVTPVIEGVIRGRAGAAIEREELLSEAILQLIKKLQEIKSEPPSQPITKPIANFNGYAAVTTFNVVHAHFRRVHPERQRLRNRIRHVVRKSARFGLWPSPSGSFVCGYASWAGAISGECSEADLDRIPPLSPQLSVSWNAISQPQITRALDHVFDHAHKPVELERLVLKIAELFRLPVAPVQAARKERIDPTASVESALVYRSALTEVWREIDLLPSPQRIALLLGLRDENGSAITSLIILLRIATFDELAAAVELSPDDLAAMWDQLPLPDTAIAERLDLTRQQVINLRKSARERLGRRLQFLRDGNPLLERASS